MTPLYDPPERSPRPTRQVDPVFIWPVPEEADRLFWVEKDMRLPKDRSFTYGQSYEDAVKYPSHKLVYVSPQNEDNISKWFYASDRTNEDGYNFQHSSCDIGGRKFDAVERTYMVPRATYSEAVPAAGTAMPTDPSGKFPVGYVLAGREQRRTETELDAIYVIETRSYVKKVSLTEYRNEDRFGGVFQSVTTLYYRGETIGGTAVETIFGDETNAYWNVQADGTTRTGQQLSEDWFAVTQTAYEADTDGPPSAPNASERWSFTEADIGGRKFSAVEKTYVTSLATYDTESPVAGSLLADADCPLDLGGDTYRLASKEARPTGNSSIDKIYLLGAITYVKRVTTSEFRPEDRMAGVSRTTETLYYRGETIGGTAVETLFGDKTNAYWDVQADGTTRAGQQISENWFLVSETVYDPGDTRLGQRTSEWGVLTVESDVVASDTAADHAEGVAQSTVDPSSNNTAIKSTVNYPTPNASGIIASLFDQDEDGETRIITDIEKILVVESEAATVAASRRSSGYYVEKKQQDQKHSVLICSKIDLATLPADETFWDSDSVRLPDTLESLEILWSENYGGGNGSSFSDGDGAFSGRANASASAALGVSIALGIKAGFSGRTKVKIVRSYQEGPPTSAPTPYNIIPSTGTIALDTLGRSVQASISKSVQSNGTATSIGTSERINVDSRVIRIGPFLTGGVTATGAGNRVFTSPVYWGTNQGASASAVANARATATVRLPGSNPSSIAPGGVVASYQVAKRWRFDVWVIENITVYAP